MTTPSLPALQSRFLNLVPRLQQQARAYFRFVRCPHRKDDLAAEAVGLAWAWYIRLVRRGKDPDAFPATFIHRALQQARAHRGVCGQPDGKDALSPLAQTRHGFLAQGWPEFDTGDPGNVVLDALADNTHSRPDVQAAFRIDFRAWLATLPRRRRALATDLMRGERPGALARKYRLSRGRISQLRAELHHHWHAFRGDGA